MEGMVCDNVSGLSVKLSLLAMMYSAPYRPNKSVGITCRALGQVYDRVGWTCSSIIFLWRRNLQKISDLVDRAVGMCESRSDLHHFHRSW
jgi:hypothetical protein